MLRNLEWLLSAGAAVAFVSCAQAQLPGQIQLALPAQDLSASLRQVSLQSGRSIVAPSDLVKGRQAPAISGPFTAEGAVRLLLTGSGLDVRQVGETLVVIRAAEGAARPGPQPSAAAPAKAGEETIVVTGTHLRGAPPTSPMIVITRDEIERSGATSVEQLMRKVPQNSESGVNQETANDSFAGGNSTEHGAGLNLRGLGQRATLVLLNGRRLAPSSGGAYVDVSLIPLSAVERVEVLTDGASAIYGSDAVGGVVNFILRNDFQGLETSLLAGTTTRGGGEQLDASVTAGGRWRGGHALLAYDYRLDDEIRAGDRPFTLGLQPGAFLLPRERRHSVLGALDQTLAEGLVFSFTGTFAHRNTTRTYYFIGDPKAVGQQAQADSLTLSGALHYRLGSRWEARLEGDYAASKGQELTQQDGVGLVNRRSTINRVATLGLNVDGVLLDLPAGPIRVAVGGELRHEGYIDRNATALVSGQIQRGNRDIRSAYGELLVPIFGDANRQPLLEKVQLSLAGRYEDYRGLASTFNPKAGVLWSPVRGLNLRGSYDTSFRAPLLSEMLGTYFAVYGPAPLVFINPAQGHGVALILGGANPKVKPERSRSWTLGGDFQPRIIAGLTASLNYYSIRFSNRITQPSPISTVVGNPAFDPIVDRSPTPAEVAGLVGGAGTVIDISGPGFSNGNATPADVTVIVDDRINNTAVTNTSGLDFLLRYDFGAGRSRFGIEANVSHVIDFTDRLTIASPAVHTLNTPYHPLAWRGRGGLSWTAGGWSAQLFANYANPYTDNRKAVLRRVRADFTVDGGLAYSFGHDSGRLSGTRIALHVDNLFDRAPPFLAPDPGSTTGLGYDPVNASARGRSVSLQIQRVW
jgi:outer membrane receptor protein involved in Fe transport